jgi:dienelactone hydrolase
MSGDLSAQMIAGIDRFLEAETVRVGANRAARWPVDFTRGRDGYEHSIAPNRERFARMIGVIDARVRDVDVQFIATVSVPAKVAETDRFAVYTVRWPVLDGLHAEGLLLQPKGEIRARVVALPDADHTPEMIAGLIDGVPVNLHYALRLVENGCQVLVPTLVDRSDTFSGSSAHNAYTNHPHREWIFRQSFVLGRHVIGYEVQKVLAAVDWFEQQNRDRAVRIGVVGWGEGGLLALYSAALDPRIDAALVSGYFGRRDRLWEEPIYRTLFGVLTEFGDADLARLIVPRTLIVEHGPTPRVDGPPAERPGRAGAAPGRLVPVKLADVRAEVAHAQRQTGPYAGSIRLYEGKGDAPVPPISDDALLGFLDTLQPRATVLAPRSSQTGTLHDGVDVAVRQERQVREMERFTQRQLHLAAGERDAFLWRKIPPTTPEAWSAAMQPYREQVWNEMIGRFPTGGVPLNPRARLIHDRPTWTAYEVVMDVLPDVYAWGYFLVPKGIKPGEKRPVVVTQHGVRGLPDDLINEDETTRAYAAYKAYAVRLAERGFIVFVPHNPYRGDHPSRGLQRKAQPIGKTIFSVILAQHECILDWLATQPSVDPSRIGFYGLSYGGQSAMRLPILLERYALSICSGDFNEWTWKNAATDWPKSYMYNNAYERPEFRMGLTFGYAEMVALLVPRPLMVERGHNDGVGSDEWVAYEYAKVNRLYAKLKIPQMTEIEYFDGPHTINGVGTFRFLHHHLNWPEPGHTRPPR